MTDDPTPKLLNMMLVAIAQLRTETTDMNSRLKRIENRIEQNSINLDRITRKATINE